MTKRKTSPPSPIVVQRPGDVHADLVTPPLTGQLKDVATATRASVNGYTTEHAVVSPPATPADVDVRSAIAQLDDIPLPYVMSKLLSVGRHYLNDTATCDAFVRAVPIPHYTDSDESSTEESEGEPRRRGIPIHLEYAVYRAPYIGRIIQSADVQQGDLVEVAMPNPHLWPVVVGWMYTGMLPKAYLEPMMKETLRFLEVDV